MDFDMKVETLLQTTSLDFDTDKFRELLRKAADLVVEQHQRLEEIKGYHDYPQSEVEAWFDEKLPERGMDMEALLSYAKEKVLDKATGNLGPHMYAYVMSGGSQVPIAAEMLANCMNQNLGKWHLGPSMNEIEKRVVQWGKEMIGYPGTGGGVMLSGGSAANLASLTVARNIYFEKLGIRKTGLFNQKPFIIYASEEVHGCVDKSADVLGIGLDHLRKIQTDEAYRIDLEALENQINTDINNGYLPFCIVGNAGTVNTGAIDDLDGLADLAKKYALWFHVDGAYGGLVAALPSFKPLYKGIERADSVAIDFHKWLYQPFEAGCFFVKDWSTLKKAYFKKADYLDSSIENSNGRIDFNEHYFQLSRNAKAFKVWMSIKAYGFRKIRQMIQQDIDLTHYLADKIEQSDNFILKSRSELAISCFQFKKAGMKADQIEAFNKKLIPALEADGRVFITGTRLRGEFAIRACLINHRKTKASCDYLLKVIQEVAQTVTFD